MHSMAHFKNGDLWVPVDLASIPDQMVADHPEWFDNCSYAVPTLGAQWGAVARSINLTAYMKHVAAQALGGWMVEAKDAEAFKSFPVFSHARP